MKLTVEDNKKLLNKFPFLFPRSAWTGEVVTNYDYSWIVGIDDLPKGWDRLFLLFCKNVKIELDKFDYTNKFVFSQVKEKYGSMRLYNNGYPKNSRVSELEYIYEHLSTYICEDCGKVAKYETPGWITELCEGCYKNFYQAAYIQDKNENKLRRKRFYVTIRGSSPDRGRYTEKYDCKRYWEEYLKCRKMSDSDFMEYILEK